ncbi:hypothetical protein [Sphingomonas mesophila]|uniref:hypothetical protein n=1 Tax=Sphingomonas mesophila TaxID=2303576 RepID=UPI000E592434|nr:hypothetical protein [Sphingomonas mesophila]
MKVVSPRGRPLDSQRSSIEKRINYQISVAGIVGGALSLMQAWALGENAWQGLLVVGGVAIAVVAAGLIVWLVRLRTFGTLKTFPQTRLSLQARHMARASWIIRFGLFAAFTLILLSAVGAAILGLSGGQILFFAAFTLPIVSGTLSSVAATVANLDLIQRARRGATTI